MSDVRAKIEIKLDELATTNHCGAGMLELTQSESKLRCRVASTDRLACKIESFHVLSPTLAALDGTALEALADRLVDRISYLEESLTVVERDSVAVESQLRSTKPLVAEDAKCYFELMVDRNGMLLHRYQKSAGSQRTAIPAVVTRAIVSRLCEDLLDLSE